MRVAGGRVQLRVRRAVERRGRRQDAGRSHIGAEERVELREHRFTKIEVTLHGGKEVARDLVALRLNPWWYPHDLYSPKDAQSGGPFTIGRVIHSSRSVGFTGWIAGVAVFDRALSAEELATLSKIGQHPPMKAP